MGRRLATVEATRHRIAAAAFELHAEIGPSRTTIRAIAERAGVQRHTVYHHFPTLDELYLACTLHGIEVTGMPEPGPWLAIADPVARLTRGLSDLYAWYRDNERMLANVLHDVDPSAPPPPFPDPFEVRMAALHAALAESWQLEDRDEGRRRHLPAVVGHALSFDTWRSLSTGGLADDEAVDLMVAFVRSVAGGTDVLPSVVAAQDGPADRTG